MTIRHRSTGEMMILLQTAWGGKYFVSNEIERQWVQNAINQNKDIRSLVSKENL